MNLAHLHTICKREQFKAAESFKIHIDNPLWPLTESIITIEINDMKQTIGQKVYGKMMNLYSLTDEQFAYMQKETNGYINRAVKRGRNYAYLKQGLNNNT